MNVCEVPGDSAKKCRGLRTARVGQGSQRLRVRSILPCAKCPSTLLIPGSLVSSDPALSATERKALKALQSTAALQRRSEKVCARRGSEKGSRIVVLARKTALIPRLQSTRISDACNGHGGPRRHLRRQVQPREGIVSQLQRPGQGLEILADENARLCEGAWACCEGHYRLKKAAASDHVQNE